MAVIRMVLILFFSQYYVGLEAQSNNKFNHVDRIANQISDSLTTSSQYIADYINSNFSTQKDKARATFSWITEHIAYDYDSMYAFNINQDNDSEIDGVLKLRKGVCQDYAWLYNDIANKVGVKTIIISGYTKQNKEINYNPHTWCASMIDSAWYLFDPTWGAGYVKNEEFIKEQDNTYFMARPDVFIKTHIPFDPLWQFLNYPLTKKEFDDRKLKPEGSVVFFNFIDSINSYENQSEIDQLISTSNRIKANGISNYLVYNTLYHIGLNISEYYERVAEEQYILAATYYSDGIYLLNQFIDYRNKYFLPYKGDLEIIQMLDEVESKFALSVAELDKIKNSSPIIENFVTHLYKSTDIELVNLKERRASLDKYLKVAKDYRESLEDDD